jgi:REP element-mobilizing transposase RayT
MPQSLSNIVLHLTFSTKDRVRALAYPDLCESLTGYIVGILKNLSCNPIATGVVIDHVHILFGISRTENVAHVVQVIKQDTSKWIKRQKPEIRDPFLVKFEWQKGYAVFSVSHSMIPKVKAYIDGQEEHHKRLTFREEYLKFLEKNNIEFDEKYVLE